MDLRFYILLISVITLTSCASRNFHAENYVANIDISNVPKPEKNPNGIDPLIISTENLDQDYSTLLSKGYILLGYSTFEAELDEKYNLLQQGRDVGATVVLTTNAFLGIHSTTVPLLLPTTSTSYTNGSFSGNQNTSYISSSGRYLGQGNSSFNGNVNAQTTTNSNQWVPMTVSKSMYKQTSAFFVKTNHPFKLGLYYRDLNNEERKKFETNLGVIITTVIENSPAFYNNILPGDMIISINDTTVNGFNDFSKILNSSQEINSIKFKRADKLLSVTFADKTNNSRDISSNK